MLKEHANPHSVLYKRHSSEQLLASFDGARKHLELLHPFTFLQPHGVRTQVEC